MSIVSALKDASSLIRNTKFVGYLKNLKDDTLANITRPILKLPDLNIKSRYIPFSATTLVRVIGENTKFINSLDGQTNFNTFSKYLYDIICIHTNQKYLEVTKLARGEGDVGQVDGVSDNRDTDYWLLQMVGEMATAANFTQLPGPYVSQALSRPFAIPGPGIVARVDVKAFDLIRVWTTVPLKDGFFPVDEKWSTRTNPLKMWPFTLWLPKNVGSVGQNSKRRNLDNFSPTISSRPDHLLLMAYRTAPLPSPLRLRLVCPGARTTGHLLNALAPATVWFEPGSVRKLLGSGLGLAGFAGLVANAYSGLLHVPLYVNDLISFALLAYAFKVWKLDTLKAAVSHLLHVAHTGGDVYITKGSDPVLKTLARIGARETFCQALTLYTTLLALQEGTSDESLGDGAEGRNNAEQFYTAGYLEIAVEKWLAQVRHLVTDESQDTCTEFDSQASLDLLYELGLVTKRGGTKDRLSRDRTEGPSANDQTEDVSYRATPLIEAAKILVERREIDLKMFMGDPSRPNNHPLTWFDMDR